MVRSAYQKLFVKFSFYVDIIFSVVFSYFKIHHLDGNIKEIDRFYLVCIAYKLYKI